MTGRAVLVAVAATLVMAASTLGAGGSTADAEAGGRVFANHCAMCHGTDASGMMGMHPSLRGAVDRLTREGVEVTVRNGRDTNPPMPAFGQRLSDDQIDQVIAYIETLPPGPRNFGPGAEDGRMMNGMMEGWMWLVPILIFAVVIAAVIWLVSSLRERRRTDRRATAREVLDRRYAAGELTREEYLEARGDLES